MQRFDELHGQRVVPMRAAGMTQPVAGTSRLGDAVGRMFAALIEVDVVGAPELCLQHVSGRLGRIAATDILDGHLLVVDPSTRAQSAYEHVEALVLDGWSLAPPATRTMR